MERLTEKVRNYDGTARSKESLVVEYGMKKGTPSNYCGAIVTKLAGYEDLEEQGLLLKLPCKVGDKVYVKMQSGKYAEADVRDFTHFWTCGFCIVVTSDKFDKQNIPFTEFGKTVFLTQAEAEEALRKMNETEE